MPFDPIVWMAVFATLGMAMAWFGKERNDPDRASGDTPPDETPAYAVPPDGILSEDFERLLHEPLGHVEAPEAYRFPPPDGFEEDEQLLLAMEEYNRAAAAHWFAARRFDELFAGLPIPCFGYDREGTIFEWNRAAESLWGYASYDVFQRSIFECVLDPGTEELFQGIIERVFAGESVQGAEFELCMPDGTNRWLKTYTYPLHTHSGRVVAALTAAIDTSDWGRGDSSEGAPGERPVGGFAPDTETGDYLEALPDPVLIVDLVGRRIRFANQHAVRRIAPDPRETIEWADIAPRLQGDGVRKLLRSVRGLARGNLSSARLDVAWTESGGSVDFDVSLSVCRRDPRGRPVEAMAVAREVRQPVCSKRERTVLSALADIQDSGIAVADIRGVIRFANEKFATLAGWPGREMNGVPISEVLEKISGGLGRHDLERPAVPAVRSEIRVEHNGPRWLEIRCSPIPWGHHDGDDADAFLMTMVDISRQKAFELQIEAHLLELNETRLMLEVKSAELEHVNQHLQGLALLDGLTGIHNHRAFRDRLAAVHQHCRLTNWPLSLLMVDVDRFKELNDTHGHPTGDRVLVQIAQVLSGSVRGTDFVARYGGEEFAVLLPFCPADRSVEVAERIRAAIASQEFPVGRVTVSIGVSTTSPGAEIGEDQLIESADSALYRAKRAGRNCVFHCGAPSSERDSA
ncbi:MAG: diguanylate cyclase [Fimbriimonadaceae bacterium]